VVDNRNYVMQRDGNGSRATLITRNTGKNWWADFSYKNDQFVLKRNNSVLDAGSNDVEGQQTSTQGNRNANYQKWKVIYVDQATKIPSEGFNEQFGFHINRPFYIRSRLPFKRIAECHGANNVWLKRWRKNVAAQQWFFDGVTKTIRNNYWKSHSLDI
jgi:hypothetical protein